MPTQICYIKCGISINRYQIYVFMYIYKTYWCPLFRASARTPECSMQLLMQIVSKWRIWISACSWPVWSAWNDNYFPFGYERLTGRRQHCNPPLRSRTFFCRNLFNLSIVWMATATSPPRSLIPKIPSRVCAFGENHTTNRNISSFYVIEFAHICYPVWSTPDHTHTDTEPH